MQHLLQTAAGSWLSRKERRHLRSDARRHETGRGQVYLTPHAHAQRHQVAAMLGVDTQELGRFLETEIDRLDCLLLTQNVGVLRGDVVAWFA